MVQRMECTVSCCPFQPGTSDLRMQVLSFTLFVSYDQCVSNKTQDCSTTSSLIDSAVTNVTTQILNCSNTSSLKEAAATNVTTQTLDCSNTSSLKNQLLPTSALKPRTVVMRHL
ncbi:hypothetical protein BsWGS_07439 [Bradybaena similaris]